MLLMARSSLVALKIFYVLPVLWVTLCFYIMDPMVASRYLSSVDALANAPAAMCC